MMLVSLSANRNPVYRERIEMQQVHWRFLLCVLTFWMTTSIHADDNTQLGLRLPVGFEVSEFADSELANDIYTMNFDDKGRLLVAGRGYIRYLLDTNHDGKADKVIQFADSPKDGAMGLHWEGDSLFCTGDGALRRFRDKDGDGRADGPSEIIRRLKTGGEHSAHAIRRGPDGWLYVICGNFTGIDSKYAQVKSSPIAEPVAGAVLRFNPELTKSEVFADGFRNAYGMGFNSEGELFTYDSDNERCVSLPWYEPTRFYHVVSGGHYGWRAPQFASYWRFPPSFVDAVPPLVTCNRGSPTGVACYRHVQFPTRYRNGFFILDWTFGIVYFIKLTPDGASYKASREVFLKSVGDNGFAPTGIAIHPQTGDLFISIGGRGTRGAIYRIRYSKGLERGKQQGKLSPIQSRSLEWSSEFKQQLPKLAVSDNGMERFRALTLLYRHHSYFDIKILRSLIRKNWDHSDRLIRQIAAKLIRTFDNDSLSWFVQRADSHLARCTLALAHDNPKVARGLVMSTLRVNGTSDQEKLAAIRALQLSLGGLVAKRNQGTVWEGYSVRKAVSPELMRELSPVLRSLLSSQSNALHREATRTLALIEDTSTTALEGVLNQCTATSHPVDDIHHLIVASRLRAERSSSMTRKIANALLSLDAKLDKLELNRDRHWPRRMTELHRELVRKDPRLNEAMLTHAEFGRPDHVLWTKERSFDRKKAAERFLTKAMKTNNYQWNAELIQLIGQLPMEQSKPVLRKLWGEYGLDDSILKVLARQPQEQDRDKLLKMLTNPQINIVESALLALKQLPAKKDTETLLALVQSIRRLPTGKQSEKLRSRIGDYLESLTGQKFGIDKEKWTAWLKGKHPELASKLAQSTSVDLAAWKKRLNTIDWSQGNVQRGHRVFAKTSCIACHSGARALGPDLRGVTERFSREDLFTAIVDPNRDVSTRYRPQSIETEQGKFYQGVVIYQAVDSVILQTGATSTIRLDFAQIAHREILNRSLMPAGLLDALKDNEIADLYAYLKSLGTK